MPKLSLWYAPGACSLATHIALRETGLSFDLIKASVNDPKDPAHLPASFDKINPKHRVPVLAIDDEILTEAPAILMAISTFKPELNLYGSTLLEKFRIAEWLNWISGTLHSQGYGALLRPARYTDDETLFPALREQAKLHIKKCYEDTEAKLTDEYAVGDSFTVADAFLFPFWRWGKRGGFAMENDYPRYTALVTRIRGRESTQAALQAEGIPAEQFGLAVNRL